MKNIVRIKEVNKKKVKGSWTKEEEKKDESEDSSQCSEKNEHKGDGGREG